MFITSCTKNVDTPPTPNPDEPPVVPNEPNIEDGTAEVDTTNEDLDQEEEIGRAHV